MIPVPASSIREATPEESEAYIDEWIKDIANHFPDFAPNALAYAEALCVITASWDIDPNLPWRSCISTIVVMPSKNFKAASASPVEWLSDSLMGLWLFTRAMSSKFMSSSPALLLQSRRLQLFRSHSDRLPRILTNSVHQPIRHIPAQNLSSTDTLIPYSATSTVRAIFSDLSSNSSVSIQG